MKKITILSIVVLLTSWWVVVQANSEFPADDCNYEEVCKDWCEDPDKNTINFNIEPPVGDCNYEEECEAWCEDPDDEDCDDGACDDDSDPENEGNLCIPTKGILFDLNIGLLKIIGYINLN